MAELFTLRAERTPDRPAYYEKEGSAWVETSWGEFHRQASRVAQRLIERDLPLGERIAILGPTRSPWAIQDLGSQLAGLVSVGIYERQTVEQVAYVLDHSASRIVFVSGREETEKVLAAIRDNPKVIAVVPWEEEVHEALAGTDPRLEAPAAYAGEPLPTEVREERLARMDPEDTSILVYTSGTTGPPKGAMISHRNILTLIQSQMRNAEIHDDDLSLSFLPVAHAAERILGFYSRLCPGIPTAYATSMATLLDEIPEVAPTIFGSVPRIFEKAYAQVHAQVESGSAAARAVFRWADSVGRRRLRLRLEEAPIPLRLALAHRIADRLVFRKIRAAFGGRVARFITGAAPIAVEILEFFWASTVLWYVHRSVDRRLRIAHAMVDAVVTAGPTSFRLASRKLHTVGHGIPTARFRDTSPEDGAPRDSLGSGRILLTVGRLSPVKRLEVLLEATARLRSGPLPDLVLAIIGSTALPEETRYRVDLEERANRLGIAEAVRFVGPVPYADLPPYARAATWIASASETGSLDKNGLEAFAARRPFFVCNEAFDSLLGPDAATFLYPPGDPVALADRIASFEARPAIEQTDLLERIGCQIEQDYDLDGLADRLVTVFERTC